ncbi:MAG: alkaline phosphatase family protein [Clostridia bacterium]|nr:alkaline phosphatase family protein [Clostridia bacterium]
MVKKMKTIVILVDGMRPDAIAQHPRAKRIMEKSVTSLTTQTVIPSVTLPCHMSLFHSVDPMRHGTTTNTYMPQVRPIPGLCEVLRRAGKTCAMFYNWEELRDLTRPDSLAHGYFVSGHVYGYEDANNRVTDAAVDYLTKYDIDFTFLYLGYVDMEGHRCGWMSEEYMHSIDNSWENIEKVIAALPDDYQIIITADHGGHDRTHGTELPEDMTIPLIFYGSAFQNLTLPKETSIKDIAPTVAALFGIQPDSEWEGKNLLA